MFSWTTWKDTIIVFQLDHFTDFGVIGLGDPGGDEDENFPLHRFHRLDQGQFEDLLAVEHDCLGDVLREQPVEGQSVRIEATQLSDEGCADRLARGHVRLQDVQQVADHLSIYLFIIGWKNVSICSQNSKFVPHLNVLEDIDVLPCLLNSVVPHVVRHLHQLLDELLHDFGIDLKHSNFNSKSDIHLTLDLKQLFQINFALRIIWIKNFDLILISFGLKNGEFQVIPILGLN